MHPYREPGSSEARDEAKETRKERVWRAVRRAFARGRIEHICTHALGVGAGVLLASVVWAHVVERFPTPVIAAMGALHPHRSHTLPEAPVAQLPQTSTWDPPPASNNLGFASYDAAPVSLFRARELPPIAADQAFDALRYERRQNGADLVLEQTELSPAARARLFVSNRTWFDGVEAGNIAGRGHGPVQIHRIDPGAMFDLLGLRAGDVLLSINGTEVEDDAWWLLLPSTAHAPSARAGAVTFEYLRSGARHGTEIRW